MSLQNTAYRTDSVFSPRTGPSDPTSMALQWTPYTLVLLLVGGLLTAFAVSLRYLGREDGMPGAKLGGSLMLAGGAWVFCFVAQLSSTTLAAKLLWRVLTTAAILSLVLVWLAYVCWYTARSEWLSRRAFGLCSLVPASLLAVAAVPAARRSLFADAELLRVGSFVVLDAAYAPLFFGYVVVGYALFAASLLLLVAAAIGSRGILRWQLAVLLSFAMLPGSAVVLDLLGYAPTPGLDFGPLSVAVTAVAGAFSVTRFGWLDLTPIARDQVFRAIVDAVVVVDADGRVVDLNRQAERIAGTSAAAAVGRRLPDLIPELASPLDARDATDEPARSEVSIATPDGRRVFDLQLSSVGDAVDDRDGYALILHDITTRKAAEERVERRNRTVERMLRVVNDLTAAHTVEAVFQRAVEGGHEMFGPDACRIAVVEGDRFVPVASAGDDHDDPSPQRIGSGFAGTTYRSGDPVVVDDLTDVRGASALDTGSSRPYRSLLSAPIGDHGVVQLLSTDSGAFDEDDREMIALFTSHVETAVDRAETEAELRDERDRLEEFASVVAHDLRNPLTIASGRLELLADAEDAPSEHVEPLRTALDRMESIITDILRLARQGDAIGEVETVDLSACVDDAWRSVDTDAARLRRADDLGTVRADRGRLQQLFENLFRNCVEHGSTNNRRESAGDTVEHGSTESRPKSGDSVDHGSTASHSDDAAPSVTVRVGPLDRATGFYVADDGPGIPPDRRDHVFEYGHSSTADGTGIGLAVVERIVRAHGWEITVGESADGGARFDVVVE
ncbi:PAS domain S-box protein [Haloplanus rubicundus]|uniref:histidine kinase n=2 Tax=Haloplanus rubicundus TaxID=1547898 RepID=A0A345EDD0_9EURY|nr:PAS domain S-box protein [Haloplanus rubicundus]